MRYLLLHVPFTYPYMYALPILSCTLYLSLHVRVTYPFMYTLLILSCTLYLSLHVRVTYPFMYPLLFLSCTRYISFHLPVTLNFACFYTPIIINIFANSLMANCFSLIQIYILYYTGD